MDDGKDISKQSKLGGKNEQFRFAHEAAAV